MDIIFFARTLHVRSMYLAENIFDTIGANEMTDCGFIQPKEYKRVGERGRGKERERERMRRVERRA